MTSNIGSEWIDQLSRADFRCAFPVLVAQSGMDLARNIERKNKLAEQVREALRAQFKPEFLNRIDEIVIFDNLTREDLSKIIDIQLEKVRERLAMRNLTLRLTDPAREMLAQEGYDPAYGARPLKRAIQHLILDPLALEILSGKFKEGNTIKADADGDHLVFSRA
jgi:ATP-dependent Clp protease ATP-binding subunit ClpB